MLLSTGFRFALCVGFVLGNFSRCSPESGVGGVDKFSCIVSSSAPTAPKRLLSCDKQSKLFLMYLGSQERPYLEAEHIFEGAKLRDSKLYQGRGCDNRRNMPLQYGLVLSFLFRGKPGHLVCQTNVEAKGGMILSPESKDFLCHPVSQGAELGILAIIGGGDAQTTNSLRTKRTFSIDPDAYRQFFAHSEVSDASTDDTIALTHRYIDRDIRRPAINSSILIVGPGKHCHMIAIAGKNAQLMRKRT